MSTQTKGTRAESPKPRKAEEENKGTPADRVEDKGILRATFGSKSGDHKQHFLLLALTSFMLGLVNQVEMPYARSLVSCDVPLAEGPEGFTGSAKCGDRLEVIGTGAAFSALGQSQEQLARFLMTMCVGTIADKYGRKPALILGLSCITVSIVLFLSAGYFESWAGNLFVMAQALQGVHGADIIGLCILGDFGRRGSEADMLTLSGELAGTNGAAEFLAVNFGIFVNALGLTDYTCVWWAVLIFALGLITFTMLKLPETRDSKDDKLQGKSFSEVVAHEVSSYRELVTGSSFTRMALFGVVCDTGMAASAMMWGPFLMAVFAYSQNKFMAVMYPIGFLAPIFTGQSDKWCRKYGHRQTFKLLWWWKALSIIIFCPINVFYIGPLPALIVWAYLNSPGHAIDPLMQAVCLNAVGKEKNSQWGTVVSLAKMLVSSLSLYVYAYCFDATATTYFGQSKIWFVCLFFQFFNVTMFWLYQQDTLTKYLVRMEESKSEGDAGKSKSE